MRVCADCKFFIPLKRGGAKDCQHGHLPADETDGCEEWRAADGVAAGFARSAAAERLRDAVYERRLMRPLRHTP